VSEQIHKAARRSGRSPEKIALVAVTKNVSFEHILPLIEAGVQFFGENRVQEALSKYTNRPDRLKNPLSQLHLIGHLQSNKAKKAVQLFDMVQSLDSADLAEVLNQHAEEQRKPMPCLVEVKISPEATKTGLAPELLNEFLSRSAAWTFLKIKGLMGIAPQMPTAEDARPFFAKLRKLFEQSKLEVLSMGMSQDYEVAIEEGATMVRIGSALFGARSYAGESL
jgi:pyridoxal phosphate enzyme (YggS family)